MSLGQIEDQTCIVIGLDDETLIGGPPKMLQVIFSFARRELLIFVGQQMDVFIDAGDHKHGEVTTPTEAGRSELPR